MRRKSNTQISVDDWKREKLKDIKFRAAYNALAEEFASAAEKIKAKRKLPSAGLSVNKSKKMRITPPRPKEF